VILRVADDGDAPAVAEHGIPLRNGFDRIVGSFTVDVRPKQFEQRCDCRLRKDRDVVDAPKRLATRVTGCDRSEDGKVDDLGPTELSGTWGTELVNAQLRVPARTAFDK